MKHIYQAQEATRGDDLKSQQVEKARPLCTWLSRPLRGQALELIARAFCPWRMERLSHLDRFNSFRVVCSMHEPKAFPDRHGTAVGTECSLPINHFALIQPLDGLILRVTPPIACSI